MMIILRFARFIAEINQEGTEKPEYKENLLKLANFTLIKFTKDSMVSMIPP